MKDVYIIVDAQSTWNLAARVNYYISLGYVPAGGVCSSGNHLYQALILKEQN